MGVLQKTSRFETKRETGTGGKFEHKVMNGLCYSSKADEIKSPQEWTEELQAKAHAADHRLKAREAKQMELEDSSSQRRRAWEKLFEPGAFSLPPCLKASS